MTETKREQIIKGIASLVAAGFVVSISKDAAGTTSCLTAFLATTVGNWVATLSLDSILPTFKRFWLNNPEENINHHINKALIAAWHTTMDEVLKGYHSIHVNIPYDEILSLKIFIDELKNISSDEFFKKLNEDNDYDEIFAYANSDSGKIISFLNERFKLSEMLHSLSVSDYLTEDFIQYFIRETPVTFNFHFRKELKEGKEAKQAIDLLYFQTIRDLVSQISREQTVQIEYLKDITASIKESFAENTFQYTVLISAVNRLHFDLYKEIAALRAGMETIIDQNTDIRRQLDLQGDCLTRLINLPSTQPDIIPQIDADVAEFADAKNFFASLDLTSDNLIRDYEAIEEEIKKTTDDFFFDYFYHSGQTKNKQSSYATKHEFLITSNIDNNRNLVYYVIPSEYNGSEPQHLSKPISSIGLIQGVSIHFPSRDLFVKASFAELLSKVTQLLSYIYSRLERAIKNKIRQIESFCIHGLRRLLSDELKRAHLKIDSEKFNFTITYVQKDGTNSCCYQLDSAALDNLIACLKKYPHPYYPTFVLIMGYTSMHAPDEFIFRYREQITKGVSYSNAALSNIFYATDNNYHIIYEVEKLFYCSDDLFLMEICRYNDFILEVTMDHPIGEAFKAAVTSLKADLEDQFKLNIERNRDKLDELFFKNFKVHGKSITGKVERYLDTLKNSALE